MASEGARAIEDEWLWGWDATPGIVSVWAEADGRAFVWRRTPAGLVRDDVRFRPWIVLPSLDDLAHLGDGSRKVFCVWPPAFFSEMPSAAAFS